MSPDHVKPRNQVVTEALNKEYQHRLLQSLVEVADERGEILENLKKINLKIFCWTAQSWKEIKHKTLSQSCRKLLGESVKTK